jgi:hypothetical protein
MIDTDSGRPVHQGGQTFGHVPDVACDICGRRVRPWDTSPYWKTDPAGDDDVETGLMCDRCVDVNREAQFVEGG